MHGYLGKGIQTPMAQGRSTKTISMIKWTRTRRLLKKNSRSGTLLVLANEGVRARRVRGGFKSRGVQRVWGVT